MRRVRDLTQPQPLTPKEWTVGLFWFGFCTATVLWFIISAALFLFGAI